MRNPCLETNTSKMIKLLFTILGIGILILATAVTLSPDRAGLKSVKALVRAKFPKARQLSTEELSQRLDSNEKEEILILDIREKPEYEISHLPGAVWMHPDTPSSEVLDQIKSAKTVVAYCSVGYRSSQFITRIQKAGSKAGKDLNLWNLEGSIFQWANENRPLENPKGETVLLVHPYNKTAGKMLEPSRRAAVEPVD